MRLGFGHLVVSPFFITFLHVKLKSMFCAILMIYGFMKFPCIKVLKDSLSLFPGSNSRHIGQIADYICGNLFDIVLEICVHILLVVIKPVFCTCIQ